MKHLLLVSVILLALAGCDSAKERAQKYYESAVTLIKAGDIDRGLVELRNVFKYDDQHREGRKLFAETLREKGDLRGAYAQYRKLVEQYPDDVEGLRALAEIAFDGGDLQEARIRIDAALANLPDDNALQAMDTALKYHAATQQDDAAAKAVAVTAAQGLMAKDPTLLPARLVVIADLIARQDLDAALAQVDAGLEIDPKARQLHGLRLGLLQQFGDKDVVETELKRMVELYPEDEGVGATLVRWYISEKRLDQAEAWLRGRVTDGSDDPEPRLTLVRFLAQLRDSSAALAELDLILALDPAPADVAGHLAAFRALHAGFLFSTGKPEPAMAEMEALLKDATASEETNRIKVGLAQMRVSTGNQVGARALVEEVLANDPGQIAALKLKANWLIEDDKTDDAVVLLRAALGDAPQDSGLMLLMARAYERQGNHPLVGDMLSRAVEASNKAPEASLLYARYLMQDGEFRSAEDVLIDALRLAPGNMQLLLALGQAHIGMQDWGRTNQDIAGLRQLGSAEALAAADELQARMLAGQGKEDELTSFLEGLAGGDQSGLGGEAAVIRAQVIAGHVDEALARAEALAAAHPEEPVAQFVLAAVEMLAGKDAEAEARLREVLGKEPKFEKAWAALYGLLTRHGDLTAADATLGEALQALPDSANLQWIQAGVLERRGDVEAAIAIYEALYEKNSDAPVIANNLASLLSSTHDDAETLDRAWNVARRLKDTKVPAFADTYGWIAYRRGAVEEALPYLELAAEGLPRDPTVQYHLGVVLAGLKRAEEARAQFAKARERLAEGNVGIPALAALIDTAEAGLGGD